MDNDVCSYYEEVPRQIPEELTDPFYDLRGIAELPNGHHGRAKHVPWTAPRRLSDFLKRFGCDGPADDDSENPPTITTLPRLRSSEKPYPTRRRPALPSNFRSGSSLKSTPSRKSLDRFLPSRPSPISSTESFRSNKDTKALTSDERLTRNDSSSQDAFHPRRIVTSPIPTPTRPPLRRNYSGRRSGSGGASVLTFQRNPDAPNGERQVSIGTVWRVGGLAPVTGVPDGRGGLLGSGTNAPLYTTTFSASKPKAQEDSERFESRLAEALELDRTSRVFEFRDFIPSLSEKKTKWDTMLCEWTTTASSHKAPKIEEVRTLPLAPFKVLDAPNLRDDFYCSVLAYSATSHTLAVGLGPLLYAWSEVRGVHLLNNGAPSNGSWLTSLAFSSTAGQKSILAFGRSDGSLNVMSLYDNMLPRFNLQQPCPIACVTWRPQVTLRESRHPNRSTFKEKVPTEDLLVGDEVGTVYYYSVEWPTTQQVANDPHHWSGSMTLLVRISVHTQQICGLSFSRDGYLFGTGGNDNLCCLFETATVLRNSPQGSEVAEEISVGADGYRRIHTVAGRGSFKELTSGAEKHRWVHGAAVKAIAFCPWKDGLVATGGGSNDKCIHFFHARSGSCLATIAVSAQVTSLIWSNTRREICATFGYAQPEHPYRIAVFSWPECKQVAAIPWEGEHRALYAIPYPGGPNESSTSREGGGGLTRTAQEGCIVVASSDESVKFHEVWTGCKKSTSPVKGLLGGSDVIEALESIDKEGDIIR